MSCMLLFQYFYYLDFTLLFSEVIMIYMFLIKQFFSYKARNHMYEF